MVRQLTFDLDVVRSYSAEDFLVADTNKNAFDHLMAFPRWPAHLTLILGPPQSGKTHLASVWAEKFCADIVVVDNLHDITNSRNLLKDRLFLLENVERAGLDEVILFNFLNRAMREGANVLMTSRLPIAQWPFRTNDVKSRMRMATILEIEPPGDTLLSYLLVKHLSDRQLEIESKVVKYLVSRMERSAQEAAEIARLLDVASLEKRKPITQGIATHVMGDRQKAMDESGKADIGAHEENRSLSDG